jgi:hypothetical protein
MKSSLMINFSPSQEEDMMIKYNVRNKERLLDEHEADFVAQMKVQDLESRHIREMNRWDLYHFIDSAAWHNMTEEFKEYVLYPLGAAENDTDYTVNHTRNYVADMMEEFDSHDTDNQSVERPEWEVEANRLEESRKMAILQAIGSWHKKHTMVRA